MSRILVSGLINLETTLRIDGFPLNYYPVGYPFGGVHTRVSGVGMNVAKALHTLGNTVTLFSLIGHDVPGHLVQDALREAGISSESILPLLEETPQSVILYDHDGRRQIHVDLKDIQNREFPWYPGVEDLLTGCDLAVCCNINFSRPLLQKARRLGKWIATDVHALGNMEDEYNRDFMSAADILFLSHENLPEPAENFARRLIDHYGNEIVVIGMGAEGAYLAVKRDDTFQQFPAIYTRPVVNAIGAGDALFASFLHVYAILHDPYQALRQAMIFASYKIGTTGAAEGFLSAEELAAWTSKVGGVDDDPHSQIWRL